MFENQDVCLPSGTSFALQSSLLPLICSNLKYPTRLFYDSKCNAEPVWLLAFKLVLLLLLQQLLLLSLEQIIPHEQAFSNIIKHFPVVFQAALTLWEHTEAALGLSSPEYPRRKLCWLICLEHSPFLPSCSTGELLLKKRLSSILLSEKYQCLSFHTSGVMRRHKLSVSLTFPFFWSMFENSRMQWTWKPLFFSEKKHR